MCNRLNNGINITNPRSHADPFDFAQDKHGNEKEMRMKKVLSFIFITSLLLICGSEIAYSEPPIDSLGGKPLTDYSPSPLNSPPIKGGEIRNGDFQMKQGIANLKEENYEEAVEDFKRYREIDPRSPIGAYYMGIAYKKTQDYKEAKTNLKDALTLSPPVKEAVVELSDVLYQLGENEEALKELERGEMMGFESARTVFLKGQILSALGKKSDISIEEDRILYKGEKYPFIKNEDDTITAWEGLLKDKTFYISSRAAIESFKKAKTIDKKLTTSADYQIAMVNLQNGNLNEAREMLKEIVIRDPNADIAQFANQYIDAITKRIKEERPFRFTGEVQYQQDGNVLLKPSDVTAAGDIAGESDSLGIAVLRGEYVPKLIEPYSIKAQYSFFGNIHNRLKNYDIQSHSITLAPNYNLKRGSITLLTGWNYTLVDNNKYLETLTLSPLYTFIINKTQFIQTSLRYQNKHYLKAPANSNEDRDGINYNGGVSWFYLLSGNKGFLNLKYEYDREDTVGTNWKYTGNKFGVSLLYPLSVPLFLKEAGLPLLRSIATGSGELNLNIGGEVYMQGFDNTHTSFKKKRDDKTYNINTMITYRVYEDMDIKMQYVYIQADSNISVYTYNKNMATIGMEYRF